MLYLELALLKGNDRSHKVNTNNSRLKRPIYQFSFKIFDQLCYFHAKYDESASHFSNLSLMCVTVQLFQEFLTDAIILSKPI